jgi:hypothetical protein
MTFLQLQTEFADLHLDTTTTWAVWWTNNKACINKAYEFLYDKLKNAERVKRKIFTQKTSVTITNKVGTLPATFDCVDRVSLYDFDTESDIVNTDELYYDYEIKGTIAGSKTIITEDDYTPLYISFVPKRVDMSTDSDVPVLPQELHRSIVDFALVEYYRRIRDNIEVANSTQLAQQYLNERLKNLN